MERNGWRAPVARDGGWVFGDVAKHLVRRRERPAGGCPRAVSDRVGSRRMLQIIVLACIFIRSAVSSWSDDTLALTGTQPFAGGVDHLDGLVRFIGAADHANAGLDGVVDGHGFPLAHQFFL